MQGGEVIAEKDKEIAGLKARIAELEEERRWRKCSEESHKKEVEQLLMEIVKLNEGAQNLILDDYLKAERVRHSNYKRCLAKKAECKLRSERYQDLWEKWRKTEYDTSGSYYKNYIKWWHRAMKWMNLAEKFKDEKETLELVGNANALCKEAK